MLEKILVSACLLGDNCKYNGGNNYTQHIIDYLKDYEVIKICPETFSGLKAPRVPSEIRGDRVFSQNNEDVTDYFRKGAETVLKIAKNNNVKKAILKSKSPSCGYQQVYDGTFSHTLIDGNGICAQLLIDNCIEVINSDDIRLK